MATLTGDYFEHVTIEGDRWDLLAWRYYGDQYRQTVLLEANRDLWRDQLAAPPPILPHGIRLKVPVIVEEPGNAAALPPWKRRNPVYRVSS